MLDKQLPHASLQLVVGYGVFKKTLYLTTYYFTPLWLAFIHFDQFNMFLIKNVSDSWSVFIVLNNRQKDMGPYFMVNLRLSLKVR